LRETGCALERLGTTLQGSKSYAEQFYRHRAVMNLVTKKPSLGPDSFVAPSAAVVGDVSLGSKASVWYGAVLRGDEGRITVGAGSNLQDGTTITTSRPSSIYSDSAWDTIVGDNVTVGHNVALHGCTIEDEALIGMGATVMQGALVQKGAMVAAGAVVSPDTVIPAGEVWGGNPARHLRALKPDESEYLLKSAEHYSQLAAQHSTETSKTPLDRAGVV